MLHCIIVSLHKSRVVLDALMKSASQGLTDKEALATEDFFRPDI